MNDPVDQWMRAAQRFPLLSPAQEVHLATMVRTWLDSPDPTPQQVRAGRRAKERMINSNLRLAAKCAFSFRRTIEARGGDLIDAMQESAIGLNRATEKFDHTRGYKFSTYATLWCNQAIRRYIQVGIGVIRAPVSAQDTLRRWRYKPEDQTIADFCEQWNLTPERLQLELQHAARAACTSLDQTCRKSHDDSVPLGDMIADPCSQPDIEALDYEAAVRRLEAAADADDLELFRQRLEGATGADLGLRPQVMKNRVAEARVRLMAAAGDETRALISGVEVPAKMSATVIALPVTSTNGLQSLERLIEAPAAEPAAPAPKRRVRRTRAEIEAAKAEKAQPAGTVKLIVNGVAVEAGVADAAQLLKHLAA